MTDSTALVELEKRLADIERRHERNAKGVFALVPAPDTVSSGYAMSIHADRATLLALVRALQSQSKREAGDV